MDPPACVLVPTIIRWDLLTPMFLCLILSKLLMFQPVYCILSSSCSYIADSCERIYRQRWINVRQRLNQFGIQVS